MSRNIPDREMKTLIALSGGVCAFPGCDKRLVVPGNGHDAAAFLGEMAHIVADSRQGPRGDSPMSDEERDQHTNLVLLCGDHHKIIDSQPLTYSVSVLRAIKADHEDRIRQATSPDTPRPPIELKREVIHSSLLPLTHLPQAVFFAPCGFTDRQEDEVKRRIQYPDDRIGAGAVPDTGEETLHLPRPSSAQRPLRQCHRPTGCRAMPIQQVLAGCGGTPPLRDAPESGHV